MGLGEVRKALRSDAPTVVVEAPAGCGKTFEAVACAIDLAGGLRPEQEVLLLAHTNVAVAEFRRRAREARAHVHATTIDAFALGLIAQHAACLKLPSPLVIGNRSGEVPFRELAPKALELLSRAPSITRALAGHYPVILLDEHQDTRQDQHDLAMALGCLGRARIFGDPMQAIYSIGDEALIDWESVAATADVREALMDQQRWPEVGELGQWILAARESLRANQCVPLEAAPSCVRVLRIGDLDDMPNPTSDRVPPAIIAPLANRLRELDGSTVVLTKNNAHVRGLFSAVRGSLVVQEGVDFRVAYAALATAEAAIGDPRALGKAVIDLLSATCRGLDTMICGQLEASLQADRLDRGRPQRVALLLDALEPLYATRDLPTWCRSISVVLSHPPDWLKVDLPASLRILARLRPLED